MFPSQAFLDFQGRRLQGVRPFAVWETINGAWKWRRHPQIDFEFPFHNGEGDVLSELQKALTWCRINLDSNGGAVGFLAYELARQIEPRSLLRTKPNELAVPDARLVFYREIEETTPPSQRQIAVTTPISAINSLPNANYAQAIACIHEYIKSGDIYQANYTERFQSPLLCSPHQLYEKLRASNPAPFAAYFEWDDFAIVSNSPERFLSLRNRVVEAQPIKGTIQRGVDSDEDTRLKLQLATSIKDRAENVMIVDLLRNDLGRVCIPGSVHVPELFQIQSFPTLHHMVSTVRGTLSDQYDAVDALRAAFPCGSITGAPKIRAMQILDELEPHRRGVAMGAIGVLKFNGDMDWNVAIRTVTCRNGHAYFHVGGGIVIDSDAPSEFNEMHLKARAIKAAIRA